VKIIVQNAQEQPVFTLDIEKGIAEAHVPMDKVAQEFVRSLETALTVMSYGMPGRTVRDYLLQAGAGENGGDFIIRTGSQGDRGEKGGDITIVNPKPKEKKCPDCVNGTQTLLMSSGLCTTCGGSALVSD